MNRMNEIELFRLFENKGKYKSTSIIFSIISIFFLVIDITLCIVNFPYVRPIFNISIILSLVSIVIYVVFEQKLENVQKYILYTEDKNILNNKNIEKCLSKREVFKIEKEKEKFNERKLINRISLDTLIKLKETLEINDVI